MMFFWNKNDETPLTQAVISGNETLVKRLAHSKAHRKATNFLGFNAEELAMFLGKEEIIRILGLERDKTFKVQKKGESRVVEMSTPEYEAFFKTKYISNPRVMSYGEFLKIIRSCSRRIKTGRMGASMRELFEVNKEQIKSGYVSESTIKWVGEGAGYGLFADRPIKKGEFVGEYTGLVLNRGILQNIQGDYCMRYPKLSFTLSYFTLDAESMGNEVRFMNHNYAPNLQPQVALENGFSHNVLVALRDIEAGEQLTYDYGEDYWRHRHPPVDF